MFGLDQSIGIQKDLCSFQVSLGYDAAVPVISIVSGLGRSALSVALVASNVIQMVAFTFIGIGELAWSNGKNVYFLKEASDQLMAFALNVGAVGYGIIEAIPIVGVVLNHCTVLIVWGERTWDEMRGLHL